MSPLAIFCPPISVAAIAVRRNFTTGGEWRRTSSMAFGRCWSTLLNNNSYWSGCSFISRTKWTAVPRVVSWPAIDSVTKNMPMLSSSSRSPSTSPCTSRLSMDPSGFAFFSSVSSRAIPRSVSGAERSRSARAGFSVSAAWLPSLNTVSRSRSGTPSSSQNVWTGSLEATSNTNSHCPAWATESTMERATRSISG